MRQNTFPAIRRCRLHGTETYHWRWMNNLAPLETIWPCYMGFRGSRGRRLPRWSVSAIAGDHVQVAFRISARSYRLATALCSCGLRLKLPVVECPVTAACSMSLERRRGLSVGSRLRSSAVRIRLAARGWRRASTRHGAEWDAGQHHPDREGRADVDCADRQPASFQ